MTALHRSGREIPVEIALAAVPYDGSYAATAFVRDISDRARQNGARRARARAGRNPGRRCTMRKSWKRSAS